MVIKPRGWAVPVGPDQLPKFFYVHKPNGSPPLDPPGVPHTGPLPESIDFPLYAREEPDTFDMVLFGDTQARGLREVNFIAHDVVEELVGVNAAFGMSLGDIVADDVNLFEEINRSIAQIGIPWYNVFGNHDYDRGAKEDQYTDEHFELVYGPATYAFEYGQVCFIPLDDVYYKEEGGQDCRLTEDQIAFIRAYLATVPKDRLIVLSMHIPLLRCAGKVELFAILQEFPHTFSISAHAHEQMQFFLGQEQGWPGAAPHHHLVHATVSGCWWCGTFDECGIPHATMNDGAPNGYSIVTFAGNAYKVRFKAARRPADYQMNIYLPEDVEQGQAAATEVLVNIFAGTERSKVEMQFDAAGVWVALEQTVTTDPEILRMHNQNEFLNEQVFGWKMDEPSKSRHMWRGTLPARPESGTHTVTVRTTDMYGQTYTARRLVRVRPDGWVAPPPPA
ncbi:MAG: calcineurin-like phosphoesterase C-terminal domain-containing protein [Candidatus Hydrogenedentes bacterium]|nr:calcineurin-like phosphoesterase C-terminal domain-containing protein [Candidatus Hydrogenedentota bacterium]